MKSNLFLLLILLLSSCRSNSIREIEFQFGEYEFEHEIDQLFTATRSGFYLKEPEFGQLIREAVQHGIH